MNGRIFCRLFKLCSESRLCIDFGSRDIIDQRRDKIFEFGTFLTLFFQISTNRSAFIRFSISRRIRTPFELASPAICVIDRRRSISIFVIGYFTLSEKKHIFQCFFWNGFDISIRWSRNIGRDSNVDTSLKRGRFSLSVDVKDEFVRIFSGSRNWATFIFYFQKRRDI